MGFGQNSRPSNGIQKGSEWNTKGVWVEYKRGLYFILALMDEREGSNRAFLDAPKKGQTLLLVVGGDFD
jgi:hypothetical protein